ncbi:hypothetical protein [Mesorhizobium sp. YM1C-6-2]|uniref:hypothetical protein n=1 Tax=Mesorhizobium sp. YM1C-6-2 TaxID=1827501 RepID=UPI000EF1BBDC|nr:hypothetical protein [Mesorhizobium sp. YM1C-6-2]RLP28342.1 hypothetical protein D8676_04170 [Mesorhizobium sp. YM1C-6-2]
MATKGDLVDWVVEALKAAGGAGTLLYVAKYIWEHHEKELRSTDLFYTWQYDMRWAATELRKRGTMVPAETDRRGKWTLK